MGVSFRILHQHLSRFILVCRINLEALAREIVKAKRQDHEALGQKKYHTQIFDLNGTPKILNNSRNQSYNRRKMGETSFRKCEHSPLSVSSDLQNFTLEILVLRQKFATVLSLLPIFTNFLNSGLILNTLFQKGSGM